MTPGRIRPGLGQHRRSGINAKARCSCRVANSDQIVGGTAPDFEHLVTAVQRPVGKERTKHIRLDSPIARVRRCVAVEVDAHSATNPQVVAAACCKTTGPWRTVASSGLSTVFMLVPYSPHWSRTRQPPSRRASQVPRAPCNWCRHSPVPGAAARIDRRSARGRQERSQTGVRRV